MYHFKKENKTISGKFFLLLLITIFTSFLTTDISATDNRKDVQLHDSLIKKLNNNPTESLRIGFEILELPPSEVLDSIRAFVLVEVGFILDKQGFPAQALTFYLQGLDLLTEIGLRPISGYLLIDIGNVYYKQKQWDFASAKYNEAIKVFESQKFPSGVYTAINNLALIEKEINNYEKAGELFNKALDIAFQLPEIPFLKAHSYGYLGDLYKSIGLTDSAVAFYDRAMSVEIMENGYNLIGLNYQKSASILIEKGDTLAAISRLRLSEIDFLTDYNVFHLIKLFTQISDILFAVNKKSEALEYLDRAFKIAEKESMILEQITILKRYNDYYKKTGNTQLLFKNLNKINELLEQRYQADVTTLIQKVDTQHLLDEYKQRIKIKELELQKSNLVRNGAITASVFLFIFLWLLFARYRYRKKYHEQMMARSEESHQKAF